MVIIPFLLFVADYDVSRDTIHITYNKYLPKELIVEITVLGYRLFIIEQDIYQKKAKLIFSVLGFLASFSAFIATTIWTNGEAIVLFLTLIFLCFIFGFMVLSCASDYSKGKTQLKQMKERINSSDATSDKEVILDDNDIERIIRKVDGIEPICNAPKPTPKIPSWESNNDVSRQRSVRQGDTAPWDTHYFNHPCPYCGKKTVRYAKWQDKQMSATFLGFFSYKLHCSYKCDSCKRMWN